MSPFIVDRPDREFEADVPDHQHDLVSPSGAARMLRVSPSTVYAWVKAGRIQVWYTPTGRMRVCATELVRPRRSRHFDES